MQPAPQPVETLVAGHSSEGKRLAFAAVAARPASAATTPTTPVTEPAKKIPALNRLARIESEFMPVDSGAEKSLAMVSCERNEARSAKSSLQPAEAAQSYQRQYIVDSLVLQEFMRPGPVSFWPGSGCVVLHSHF